jgi:hypothetical protein
MPETIAFAGGNDCENDDQRGGTPVSTLQRTVPTTSLREVLESAEMVDTVLFSDSMVLPLLSRNSGRARACC